MTGVQTCALPIYEIPKYEDFDKTMADYLTFEFNMITHGRGYLFGLNDEKLQNMEQGNE